MTPTSHVFVLVEEPLLRITLRLLLTTTDNLIFAGEAAFIYDLPSFTVDNCPQVLLCEIGGGKIICDYVAYLRQWVPPIRIIALVDRTSQLSSTQLLQHELCACLFKSEITDTLPQIIHLVAQGGTWFSRAVVERLLQQETKPCLEQATPTLTKRERQVLELVVKGQSNSEIAAALQVAEQTVRNYISQVYSKLDLRDRTDAIIRFDRLISQ